VFIAGWLGLPGGPLYWTIVPLILLIFPAVVQCAFGLGRAFVSGRKGNAGEVLSGFWKAAFIALLNLIDLPHQALVCLDAIVRALVRRFITGERLLEWETAAQAELHSTTSTPIDRYLALTPIVAFAAAVLVFLVNPRHHHALVVASPILLLWALCPFVAAWLNAPIREQNKRLDSRDEIFLLAHALRIWRYFREFGGERHNYLIPDNVEEDGLFEAARVSPTNLGLLLNARQAACEFGFLTVPEFVVLTNCSLATLSGSKSIAAICSTGTTRARSNRLATRPSFRPWTAVTSSLRFIRFTRELSPFFANRCLTRRCSPGFAHIGN
jgi:cyclic beta-1,2-glucan synthetase